MFKDTGTKSSMVVERHVQTTAGSKEKYGTDADIGGVREKIQTHAEK